MNRMFRLGIALILMGISGALLAEDKNKPTNMGDSSERVTY